jgi:hypothetical protein
MNIYKSIAIRLSVLPLCFILICTPGYADATDSSSLKSDVEQGRILFNLICVGCHQLPSPELFTINQWKFVIKKMKRRIILKRKTAPTELEVSQILVYLQKHSKK